MSTSIDWAECSTDSPAAASLPTAPEPSAASETAQRVEIVVQTNNGKVERVTRRFGRGTRRVLLGVKERAAWETFTDPRHASVDEEILSVDFVLPEVINAAGEDEEEDDHTVQLMRCTFCGALGHGAFKCPKKLTSPLGSSFAESMGGGEGMGMGGGSLMPERKCRLRVSPLAEDVDEEELRTLLERYGSVERFSLQRNRETNLPYAAWVTYYSEADAANAKEQLDGMGFHYLILKAEWAKVNTGAVPGMGAAATTFRSGYGKALPQNVKP